MRWRVVLLVAALMAVLAVAGRAALAATIDGTGGDDRITADSRDVLDGCNRVSRP